MDHWRPAQGEFSGLTVLMRELANLSEYGCERLQREYVRLFVAGASGPPCSLYERSYRAAVQAEATPQEVHDTYAMWGVQVPLGRADRLDSELEFMTFLYDEAGGRASRERVLEAKRQFCKQHLSAWIPQFTEAVKACAVHGFYLAAGAILDRLIQCEIEAMELPRESGPRRVWPGPGTDRNVERH